MWEKFLTRIYALLSVKSIITLALTGVFIEQVINGSVNPDFMTIYTVIIAFYFGTQAQKIQDVVKSVKDDAPEKADENDKAKE